MVCLQRLDSGRVWQCIEAATVRCMVAHSGPLPSLLGAFANLAELTNGLLASRPGTLLIHPTDVPPGLTGGVMRKFAAFGISLAAIGLSAAPAVAADANGNHAAYVWVVGATTPSDTAMAPDGSAITMTGVGHLMAGPGGIATGGGTYMKSGGETGTWTATAVDGFVSYGSGAAQGLPANFFGGEAKLSVSLSNGQTGVLTIICVLGSPPSGKMEGIQLVLGTGVSGEYTKQVLESGTTVFIKS